MLQFSTLSRYCNISHFITTREGGVSKGAYASMNLGWYSSDDNASVCSNFHLLAAAVGLPADRIIAPYQVHKDDIRVLTDDFLSLDAHSRADFLRGADALVTHLPHVCVSVATADCVPVLLYAPDKNVVAAVHAGWRGTVLRIAAKTVRVMVENYGCDASKMVAGIGPSISCEAFEVGEEVVDAFSNASFDLEQIVVRHSVTSKAHIDLWAANRLQLMEVGLLSSHIETAEICTYTHYNQFFSARRLGIRSGRMLSGIFIDAHQ